MLDGGALKGVLTRCVALIEYHLGGARVRVARLRVRVTVATLRVRVLWLGLGCYG